MRKYVPLLAILIILLVIWGAFNFSGTKEEKKTFKNVTELYSEFSDYTKDFVDYRLQNIKCSPSGYYYENSSFCFICESGDACFEYWVNDTKEKKMNLINPPKLKTDKFDVNFVNFYKNGLASYFNCKEKNENTLSCDYGIDFVLNNNYKNNDANISIVLNDENNWNEVSNIICKKLKRNEFSCEKYDKIPEEYKKNFESFETCKCEDSIIVKIDNTIFYSE